MLVRCFGMGKRGRAIQPAGSKRQRTSGSWELRAYAGVDALTGKVRFRTRTVRASKTEAAKALRELVASAQAGPAFGTQASFATLLEAWIAAKEPGWSKSTLPPVCRAQPCVRRGEDPSWRLCESGAGRTPCPAPRRNRCVAIWSCSSDKRRPMPVARIGELT